MSRRPESIFVTRNRRANEGKAHESCPIDSLEIYSIAQTQTLWLIARPRRKIRKNLINWG